MSCTKSNIVRVDLPALEQKQAAGLRHPNTKTAVLRAAITRNETIARIPRSHWEAITAPGVDPLTVPPPGPLPAIPAIPAKKRPKPTMAMIQQWAVAATGNRHVSLEVQQQRQQVCQTCEYLRLDNKGQWCGRCGCAVAGDIKKIFNLSSFVEKLDAHATVQIAPGVHLGGGATWGCKHPQRGKPIDPSKPDGPAYGWPLPPQQKRK